VALGHILETCQSGEARDKALGRVRSGCGGPGAAARAQEADINKAVGCMTLSQQCGHSVKTAKVEDGVKKAATDLLKQGDKACMAHDYDAGMDQMRKALQQIGLKPAV
jgi:hypothetical protein